MAHDRPTADSPPSDPKRLDATLLMTLAISAALIAAGVWYLLETRETITAADFAFAPIEVDAETLARERQERFGAVEIDERWDEPLQKLYEAAYRANQSQFAAADDRAAARRQIELTYLADEVAPAVGLDKFVMTGQPIFAACNAGLDDLLEAVRSGEVTLEQAKTDPPAEQFSAYRMNCGNVLPFLLEHEMVDERGRWSEPSMPLVFDVLNRYRWAAMVDAARKAETQLTPYEYRILTRWRIEDAVGMPLRARRRYLNQLPAQMDYDVGYARAILDYEAGNLEGALAHLERLGKTDPRRAAMAAWLREKIAAEGPATAPAPAEKPASE